MWLLLPSLTMVLISQIPQTSVSCSSMPFFALDYLHLESVLLCQIFRTLELFSDVLDFLFVAKLRELDLPTVVSDHAHNLFPATSTHVSKGVMTWFGFSVVRNVTVIFI